MGFFSRLGVFWAKQPRWAPYAYTLLALSFIWIKPGAINQFFGKDIDLSGRQTASGIFKRQQSQYDPYYLIENDGSHIRLVCDAREQKTRCLNGILPIGIPVNIIYAPFKSGWPNTADGVILQIADSGSVLVSEKDRLIEITQPRHLTLATRLLVLLIGIIGEVLPISAVAILLGSGILYSFKSRIKESVNG